MTYEYTHYFDKFCDHARMDFKNEKTRHMWIRLHTKKCKICEEGEKHDRKTLRCQILKDTTNNQTIWD
jgi:hypothetical protein